METDAGVTGGSLGEVTPRPITPADAAGLSELIRRCYGEDYPRALMYRPEALAESVRSGDYGGVVAEADGSIVGHIGYSWPNEGSSVTEAGTTVVDPGWRGRGLMKALALALVDLLVADGAVGFIHFPTTAHTVMQRASLATGGRETGIMIACLPAEVRDHTISRPADHRLTLTVAYQPLLEAAPQSVYLPRRYEGRILEMAASLGIERSSAGSPESARPESRFQRSFDELAGLQSMTVQEIGLDLPGEVEQLIRESSPGTVHLDLPMDDPGIDDAVEQMRAFGFAFCAWLPGWAGHDVLRLQRVANPTDAELAPTLFSPEAEALMISIRQEMLGPT